MYKRQFRDRVKKIVKGWQENYGRQSLEMVIDTLAETREDVYKRQG